MPHKSGSYQEKILDEDRKYMEESVSFNSHTVDTGDTPNVSYLEPDVQTVFRVLEECSTCTYSHRQTHRHLYVSYNLVCEYYIAERFHYHDFGSPKCR